MPKDADTTHGAGGRPKSRAAASVDPGLRLRPTLADMKNAGISDGGTAGDLRGAARGSSDPGVPLSDPAG